MEKLDLKKELKQLYAPSAKAPSLVEIPPMWYLMIDGEGDPNTAVAYQEAIQALYAVAYTLRFAVKAQEEVAYTVMPLEGLWWVEDPADFATTPKDEWKWTAMIVQPDLVSEDLCRDALESAAKKKDLPALSEMRFELLEEGLAAQVMHIGPYADEEPTIRRLHAFIQSEGYELRDKHHEIYLSDPRRTPPEKCKTVIRHPVG
jgi:hypothetical protein